MKRLLSLVLLLTTYLSLSGCIVVPFGHGHFDDDGFHGGGHRGGGHHGGGGGSGRH